jgi:hypothetical protein
MVNREPPVLGRHGRKKNCHYRRGRIASEEKDESVLVFAPKISPRFWLRAFAFQGKNAVVVIFIQMFYLDSI